MSRDVTLHLDEFGQQALKRFAWRRRGSEAAAVRTACLYYLADREAARPAWPVPSFAAGAQQSRSLDIELDDETWRGMTEEAHRQGVAVETLAVHAVLYFLADLDSGRLAGLLEGALEDIE